MPRRFNKKNATTFNVVHRAHDDARFYDDEASEHVLVPQSSKKKVVTTAELEKKLANTSIRDNEGLAAQYGITYDDSKYDYMQHLKPMGNPDGVFVGAKQTQPKQLIEDLFKDQLPSKETRKVARDLNQNIPDELQGFNPNLDPRLREVLEALDDEAYIEDGEEDIFNSLLQSGEVEDENEFYEEAEDYDEWDLDNYEEEYDAKYNLDTPEGVNLNWQRDFMQFKKDNKNKPNEWDSDDEFEDEVPELPEISTNKKVSNTKMRKKKGAMTDTSSFSMSSSALFRTEGLTLLDDRYEQMSKKFENENDEPSHKPFNMNEERHDLEGMLDDFLDNYELESGGRKLAKKDDEKKKLQQAASSVSKGKAARKFNKAFSDMKIE